MSTRKLKIVVSGMIAGDPYHGGATWAVLQYVIGFRQLGHEVLLVEPIQTKALQPSGARLEESENAKYFAQVIANFELTGHAALLLAGEHQTFNLEYEAIRKFARSADLLINISGMLQDETLSQAIPVRVYLDLDPGFNQLWNAVQGIDMRFPGHTHHVTIGKSIGTPDCPVPTCGLDWLGAIQPVVLDHLPAGSRIEYNALTTVANWRGYGSVEHNGVHYGQKAHSLRQFLTLPTLTKEQFLLALSIHPGERKDLEALEAHGWQLADPAQVASSPRAYQQFIQCSKAEFGVAKSGYVLARSGWFSDRSACYLASGRPVIAQETGFSSYLPTGRGLFAFRTLEDILYAIEEINGSYEQHSQAARQIAEEFFDSRKVVGKLLKLLSV